MIIALGGRMGSGKDTVGQIIQFLTAEDVGPECIKRIRGGLSIEGHHNSTFQNKKFAGKLKQIASILTGVPIEMFEDQEFKKLDMGSKWGMTYREFLQKLGTDAMRDNLHKSIWVNALFADIDRKITIEEEKRLNSIWKNINTRCSNSNYEKYHRYGGVGIVNEFKDFYNFVSWSLVNGYTNDLTLDRKDGKANYNTSNCRWVISDLQSFNKLKYTNSKANYKGVSKTKVNNKNPYIAQIQSRGEKENLGYFKTEEEAKIAYDKRYLEILKILEEENNEKLYNSNNTIITDMRFTNEMEAVKERKGITIRVVRPYDYSKGIKKSELDDILNTTFNKIESPYLHPSETALDDAEFDYTIENDGSIQDLIEKIRIILLTEKIIN